MNALNKAHGPRIRQAVRCCNVLYSRWRPVDGPFPGTHHTQCVMCGAKLRWPRTTEHGQAAAAKRYYHRIARERRAAGLTTRGTPWKRRPNGCQTSREVLRRDNLECYHARADRRAAQGLTTRGTERKRAVLAQRKPARMTDQEWAWRQLRASMNIKAPDVLLNLQRAEEESR